ncbi:MAG: hypothetical protein ABIH00_07965 [Armatimonadota bacterium]
MPSGVTLKVYLSAPSGCSCPGIVTLNTTAQSAITSIETNAAESYYTIYLSAIVEAGLSPDGSRVITFTLTDE